MKSSTPTGETHASNVTTEMSNTDPSSKAPRPGLLSLPDSVLREILRHSLPYSVVYWFWFRGSTAVMRVNKRIASLAREVLYSENSFQLRTHIRRDTDENLTDHMTVFNDTTKWMRRPLSTAFNNPVVGLVRDVRVWLCFCQNQNWDTREIDSVALRPFPELLEVLRGMTSLRSVEWDLQTCRGDKGWDDPRERWPYCEDVKYFRCGEGALAGELMREAIQKLAVQEMKEVRMSFTGDWEKINRKWTTELEDDSESDDLDIMARFNPSARRKAINKNRKGAEQQAASVSSEAFI